MIDSDWLFPNSIDYQSIPTKSKGPVGKLPLTDEFLRDAPSGDIFGLTQNAGMGWNPDELNRRQMLILSTQGGLRAEKGEPIALGFHTGHWEIGLLVKAAALQLREEGYLPFSATVSDPCDGRTQGTTGMMDSLPYRNDAAQVFRRLIRSLPTRKGVIGIATCDKGLPAMMMALASLGQLPGILIPGGVTLPTMDAEDAGAVQTLGARYAHGLVSLEYAAEMGCKACGSPGGGCQFLGTAATAQVVGEALGMSLPHSALAPSGTEIWTDMAVRSAVAMKFLDGNRIGMADILTDDAIYNAMVVHAAFGGSTNLLLHIPAIAYSAGLRRPVLEDWTKINRMVPRIVDALPNGPKGHPTVQVFMAGGVPEVMLHLRELGLLRLDVMTVTGRTLGENLDNWEASSRRTQLKEHLFNSDGISDQSVIMSPENARLSGMTSTVTFPVGNLAPEGSVIKSTSIDSSVVDPDGVYRKRGYARVFVTERAAIAAIKSHGNEQVRPGEIIVLIGRGPIGCGMEEIYQITSALKFLPWGKEIAVITDARFSGVSTGACIGHVGPEALAGGPIGKLVEGDLIEIIIDRNNLVGSLNLIGWGGTVYNMEQGTIELQSRNLRSDLTPDPRIPDDTRLWAALQGVSGGTWGGCIYDVDAIITKLSGV